MKISFSAPSLPRSGPVVVGVLSGGKLLATAERLDKAADGALSRAMDASRFKGESGQSLTVMAPAGVGASRVVLMGLGEAERFDDLAAQAYGGSKHPAFRQTPLTARCWLPTGLTNTGPRKRLMPSRVFGRLPCLPAIRPTPRKRLLRSRRSPTACSLPVTSYRSRQIFCTR